jgi:mono/diheme cytochrome c family protein
VLLAAAVLLTACSSQPQPTQVAAVPPPQACPTSIPTTGGQPSAASGAVIFTRNCTFCHGNEGQGVDAPPLRNNQAIQPGSAEAIAGLIANGVPNTAMPAWLIDNGGPLSAGEINNVVAFLNKLQGVAQIPPSTAVPPEPTEAPPPANAPTPEPAQPSSGGNPGPAASLAGDAARGKAEFGLACAGCHGPQGVLGIPNPDSDDGSVPSLNPIDSTMISNDPKVFAANIDRFIEHGSTPAGPGPRIAMPAFGDDKLLTDQQIADLIAYVMSLNSGQK